MKNGVNVFLNCGFLMVYAQYGIAGSYGGSGASLVAQLIKNLPAMQETPIQFLGQEDPLEKEKATHSRIYWLPWWLRR